MIQNSSPVNLNNDSLIHCINCNKYYPLMDMDLGKEMCYDCLKDEIQEFYKTEFFNQEREFYEFQE